jgi:hypothetical protein
MCLLSCSTNNDNYRKEWPQVMFYTSGEACCQKHFGMECEMIDDCSSSPAPDNTEPSKSCENKWHMATDGTKNTCTNDLSFPASWTNPHIAKNTLVSCYVCRRLPHQWNVNLTFFFSVRHTWALLWQILSNSRMQFERCVHYTCRGSYTG